MQDIIVVGGGYAGMAAALQLLRARRKVTVIDAGIRRNRAASRSHGFLGQDGVDPEEIARKAKAELHAYPTLTWRDGTVSRAAGRKDDFRVSLDTGETVSGRRLLFATGVADDLPAVPGLAERWGQSVFHCPYCHGFELDEGAIGVIASGPMSIHQGQLLPDWGSVTFLTNGVLSVDRDTKADFDRRGVITEHVLIARIEGTADVVLVDGRRLSFAGLFTAPRCAPASPVAEAMGCDLLETAMGLQIRTTEARETSIPGAFACGDAARVPHSVSLAVADGAWAGAQLHRSLVWPED